MEYAIKAVENSGTIIGLRGTDGVVFAVEKLVTSKLYEAGANRRVFSIDKHVGMVSGSISMDLRFLFLMRFMLQEDVRAHMLQT